MQLPYIPVILLAALADGCNVCGLAQPAEDGRTLHGEPLNLAELLKAGFAEMAHVAAQVTDIEGRRTLRAAAKAAAVGTPPHWRLRA